MTTTVSSPDVPTRPAGPTVARRLLAVAGAAALGVLAWTTPASAHSELIGSTPAEGEQVGEAPSQVVLEFNEHIQDIGAEMVVTNPDGQEINTGEGEVDGPNFSQDLTDERPGGDYEIQWRVVSADGHPISGEFTFTASADTGAAAPQEDATEETEGEGVADAEGETAPAEETDPPEEEDPSDVGTPEESLDQDGSGFPWGIAFAVVAIGALVALIVRARQMSGRGQEAPGGEDDQNENNQNEEGPQDRED